jgi:hypothetical protein
LQQLTAAASFSLQSSSKGKTRDIVQFPAEQGTSSYFLHMDFYTSRIAAAWHAFVALIACVRQSELGATKAWHTASQQRARRAPRTEAIRAEAIRDIIENGRGLFARTMDDGAVSRRFLAVRGPARLFLPGRQRPWSP